jgi:Mn-dependent DtxR family transcriptional regulator
MGYDHELEKNKMHESGEDYLETIYILLKKNGYVRSVDVATELGFSRPSVSRGVGLLKDAGLIVMAEDGSLKLTDEGTKKAKAVYEKHTTLTRFLVYTAGVDAETAENDACRIEHIISPQTFKGIKKFMKEHKDQ